jgi:hypothetical protein
LKSRRSDGMEPEIFYLIVLVFFLLTIKFWIYIIIDVIKMAFALNRYIDESMEWAWGRVFRKEEVKKDGKNDNNRKRKDS